MTYIDTHGPDIFAALVAGLVVWQLLSGTALGGRGQQSVTRADNPLAYWIRLLFQGAILAVVMTTGKTRWQQSLYSRDSTRQTPTAQAPELPAVVRRREAFRLHRAGQFAEALPVYDTLLADADIDVELHFFRGIAHWKLAHNDLALQDFRRVIALDTANFTANQYADRILSAQQRWDEVIAIWNNFIRYNPANAEAYYERGGTYFHKGDLAASFVDATKSCELGKKDGCAQAARLKGR